MSKQEKSKSSGKSKFMASFLVLAILMVLTISGCVPAQSVTSTPAPTDSSYEVTDSRGNVTIFEKIPETVVSLLPSDTEIVCALGDIEKLIAVDIYSNYPAEVLSKPMLETADKLNIEEIISMNPDLVLIGVMAQTAEQFKQLEDAGIHVIATDALDIEGTYDVISIIGKALGRDEQAAQIIDDMKTGFENISEQVKDKPSVKVYIEASPLQFGLWTCGQGTFQDEILSLIGAQNIFGDVTSWAEVSEEQVIERNPEVIITTVGPMFGVDDPVAEIKARTNWQSVDALLNNKVYMADSDSIQRPGPRLVEAAQSLVTSIYGE